MIQNKKVLIVGITVMTLAIIFIIGSKLYRGQEAQRIEFMAKSDFKLFVPDHAIKLGALSPEVHLVEFLDPECESCREFYPHVKMLMQEFEGKIQLVLRYAPFHPNSRLVIKILEAARKQNRYWETLEVLFLYQPQWGSHHHPRPDLIWKYLPEARVNVDQIRKDMNDPSFEAIIEQDLKDGMTLGVRATPTFFINGKPLETFSSEALREAIRSEIR
jgi:protein-disulfide isomerase